MTPFITFEDIKKDLEDMNYIATAREKENFVIKEPNYDVYIAPSKIDRLGLFIRTFVKKNTIVAEYIGEVISEAIADIREEKFHFGCYMFGLVKNNTRQEIIDATFIGNMARYLNHSCDVAFISLSPTARPASRWSTATPASSSIPSRTSRKTRNLPTITSSRSTPTNASPASARPRTARADSPDPNLFISRPPRLQPPPLPYAPQSTKDTTLPLKSRLRPAPAPNSYPP